ncbi:MAG TPA: hypothetical protein ENG40_01215 [Thermoprotei archaeon]|nr:hypothetical protein [Thermoprotei archaeon]
MICPICREDSLYVKAFHYDKDTGRVEIFYVCDRCSIGFEIDIREERLAEICWHYLTRSIGEITVK